MQEHIIGSSAKIVVWHENSLLLGLNNRGEWELPGGRPGPGDESLVETVYRGLREETGLNIEPAQLQLVDAELYQPIPDAWVSLVCFATHLNDSPHTLMNRQGYRRAKNTPLCGFMRLMSYRKICRQSMSASSTYLETSAQKWREISDYSGSSRQYSFEGFKRS